MKQKLFSTFVFYCSTSLAVTRFITFFIEIIALCRFEKIINFRNFFEQDENENF